MGSRATNRSASGWTWVVFLGVAVAGGMLFAAKRVETAPAPRAAALERVVEGPAGGIEAELDSLSHAVVFATREPDGSLSVECTDHEIAAAILAEVRP